MQTIQSFTLLDISTILNLSEPVLNTYLIDLSSVISVAKGTPGYIFSTLSDGDLDSLTDSQLLTYTVNLSSLMQTEARNVSYLTSYSYASDQKSKISESTLTGLSTIAYTDSVMFANYSTLLLRNRSNYASSISTVNGYQALIDASASDINKYSTILAALTSTISGESLLNLDNSVYEVKRVAFEKADLKASTAQTLAAHTSTVLEKSLIASSLTGLQYQQVSTADLQAIIDISNNSSTIRGYTTLLSDLSSAIQSTIVADKTLRLESETAIKDLSYAIVYSTFTSLNDRLLSLQTGGALGDTDPDRASTIEGLRVAMAAIDLRGPENAVMQSLAAQTAQYEENNRIYLSQRASNLSTSVGYSKLTSNFLSTAESLTSTSAGYRTIFSVYDISAKKILLDVERLSTAAALTSSILLSSISSLNGVELANTAIINASNAFLARSKILTSIASDSSRDLAEARLEYNNATIALNKAVLEDISEGLQISKEQAALQTTYYTMAFNNVKVSQASVNLSIANQFRYQGEYGYKEYLLRQNRVSRSERSQPIDTIAYYITACEELEPVESTLLSQYRLTSTILLERAPISISGDIIQGEIRILSTTTGLKDRLLRSYSGSTVTLMSMLLKSGDEVNRASSILATAMIDLSSEADVGSLFSTYKTARFIHMSNSTLALNNSIQMSTITNEIQASRASISELEAKYSYTTLGLSEIDTRLKGISSVVQSQERVARALMSTIDNGVSTQLFYADMQELLLALGYGALTASGALQVTSGALQPASGALQPTSGSQVALSGAVQPASGSRATSGALQPVYISLATSGALQPASGALQPTSGSQPVSLSQATSGALQPTSGSQVALSGAVQPASGARATSGAVQPASGARATSGALQPASGARATSGALQPTSGSRATSGALQPASGSQVALSGAVQPTSGSRATSGALQPASGARATSGAVQPASGSQVALSGAVQPASGSRDTSGTVQPASGPQSLPNLGPAIVQKPPTSMPTGKMPVLSITTPLALIPSFTSQDYIPFASS